MADDKDKSISQLTPLGAVDGSELIPVAKGGDNFSITAEQIAQLFQTFKVVDVLPASPAPEDRNKIFLVPTASARDFTPDASATGNNYTEYVYVNNLWEQFGQNLEARLHLLETHVDTLEFVQETLNTGLGEADKRLDALEEGLNADKENLKNFKAHVEADFVKDTDYNNDKATIMGQIMNKVDKDTLWIGTEAEYAKTTPKSGVIYFITG